VSLPWKCVFSGCLNFNKNQALSRLYSLEHRLFKSDLMDTYCREMDTKIEEFAQPVLLSQTTIEPGWYLDLFPVLRPGKSTSCRNVWNSAAVYDGVALNNGLHKALALLNSLFRILLAWRLNFNAIVGDIKKMFNQYKLLLLTESIIDFFGGTEI